VSDAAVLARPDIETRALGLCEYGRILQDMRAFTDLRGPATDDELWWLQHYPVYTQGLNCTMRPRVESEIPVVSTDRGGQITYHGPGQLIVYVLYDLNRRARGIKWMVDVLEQTVIDWCAQHGIAAARRAGAPGVYVDGAKLAALGLRVRRGSTYHGLSLNVDMDLAPFTRIDPCGFAGLAVTQLRDLGVNRSVDEVGRELAESLAQRLVP